MGDIVQTLPAAADLRLRFPEARIDWVVDQAWEALLAGNPHIDAGLPFPLRMWRRAKASPAAWRDAAAWFRGLRSGGYDLAVDFQGLMKSAVVARLSGARSVLGFDRGQLREPAAEFAYDRCHFASGGHVVDRYRELAAFGAPHAPRGSAVFPLPPGQPHPDLPDRFVLASPGAGWASKQWPADYFCTLAAFVWQDHGIPLVLDCPRNQRALAEAIHRTAPADAVIVHPSSIAQLIAATRRALAVVGVDSGPLHLAAALGKPGVAIFGPTDPARNGPFGDSLLVIRAPQVETTYKRGRSSAPSMRACTPALVYDTVQPFLR